MYTSGKRYIIRGTVTRAVIHSKCIRDIESCYLSFMLAVYGYNMLSITIKIPVNRKYTIEWRIYIPRVGQQINTKMIIERAHKQFIARLCTFFFLTGHDQPIPIISIKLIIPAHHLHVSTICLHFVDYTMHYTTQKWWSEHAEGDT